MASPAACATRDRACRRRASRLFVDSSHKIQGTAMVDYEDGPFFDYPRCENIMIYEYVPYRKEGVRYLNLIYGVISLGASTPIRF
jgi:hypothetical protein